tara:strand:- start:133 stop:1017 length:885 start_codon:yes stop_codon:yes gene_type:complete
VFNNSSLTIKNNNLVNFGITFFLLFFSVNGSFAQESITIQGKIENKDGVAIPFCSVIIKEKQKGVYSDLEGKFEIKANKEYSLVFSHLSHSNKTVAINDLIQNQNLIIQLNPLSFPIPAVDIVPKKMKLVKFKNSKRSHYSFGPSRGYTVAYHLTDHVGGLLQEVTFYLRKPNAKSNVFAGIRIFRKDDKMSNENNLYIKNDVRQIRKRKLKVDFSDDHIEIPPEGLLVGLEYISFSSLNSDTNIGRLKIYYTNIFNKFKTYVSTWGNDWRLDQEVHLNKVQNMKISYKVLVEE